MNPISPSSKIDLDALIPPELRGRIFNCALKDEVLARLKGEPDDLRLVEMALSKDFAADVRRNERDKRIRSIAARLRAVMIGASDRRLAAIVAAAGAMLQIKDRGLDGAVFDGLAQSERAALAADVRSVLRWAPPVGAHGDRWPKARHVFSIIKP